MAEAKTWENLGYKELGEFIGTKTDELSQYFKSRTRNGQIHMDPDEVEIVRARNKELEDANKRYEQLKEVDAIYQETVAVKKSLQQPASIVPFANGDASGQSQPPNNSATKSLGELFTQNHAYKSVAAHNDMTNYAVDLSDFDYTSYVKTTMTTAAGYAPPNNRTAVTVDFAVRRPMVGDLVPTDATTVGTVKYMEETTFTNNAAGVAENAAKPESALAWTERTVPIEVIATYIPVTNQQLDDVPGIQGIINNRLSTMVSLKEEDYLLNGTGTPPQMTGFMVKAGTNSQARGSDSNVDAIFKGMQLVRTVGFAEPTGIVLHPTNWTSIRLMKTADGIYIWGSPSEIGPERIFGKPVVVTTAMTENSGLTGDFQLFSHISRRMGITVIVGMINDDLVKNKRTILAELRESLEIYRPAAFTILSSLN
jgi:HK97 family phage major capsid protein